MQHNKHTNCLTNKLLQMKKLILLTIVFFTFFSCKKYKPFEIPCTLTQDSSLAKQYIKGTWEWVEEKRFSEVNNKYIFTTPRTEGYTLRMIIGDSLISLYKNSEKTDFKYKIQLWGEISGYFLSSQDYQPTLVFYNLDNGNRYAQAPILICNEYLQQDRGFASSIAGLTTWKKL